MQSDYFMFRNKSEKRLPWKQGGKDDFYEWQYMFGGET